MLDAGANLCIGYFLMDDDGCRLQRRDKSRIKQIRDLLCIKRDAINRELNRDAIYRI